MIFGSPASQVDRFRGAPDKLVNAVRGHIGYLRQIC